MSVSRSSTHNIMTSKQGEDQTSTLRVNFENVVKQGVLSKKGSILRLYNSECMVYLERRAESIEIG